jgi:hypothetical protein
MEKARSDCRFEFAHPSSIDTWLVLVAIVQNQVEIPDDHPSPNNLRMDGDELIKEIYFTRIVRWPVDGCEIPT